MDGHWAKNCPKNEAHPKAKAMAEATGKRRGTDNLEDEGNLSTDSLEVAIGLGAFVELTCIDGTPYLGTLDGVVDEDDENFMAKYGDHDS